MARILQHEPHLKPCPYLPGVEAPVSAAAMREVRDDNYGSRFYEQALKGGQSLWLQGLPAQALLMFNRAFGADLNGDEPILDQWPLPYAASAWVMKHREEDQFIGNPRRHFQHLATRMVEPRKARRSARAWACWLMACQIFPDYPADEKQIAEEGVVEPSREEVFALLEKHGLAGEPEVLRIAEELVNRLL
ncbi:MAG: hypothetical protein GXP30_06145 [Verrucomicrobia bacterium]|nr:hypothetical protein [Verrucomicrobiota bacterium]